MFFQLFWTYLKIGTFTLGGGYAMLPLIQREVVDRKGWIDEERMRALAQPMLKNQYGQYLLKVIEDVRRFGKENIDL